jgi:hypothetical protein
LAALNLIIFGAETCLEWAHCCELRNALLFGKQNYYDSPWNFISLENIAALSSIFRPYNQFVKPIAYLFVLSTLIFQTIWSQKIILSKMSGYMKKEALLFAGIAFLPLNSIYLHEYDLVLYLPLYWIMLVNRHSSRFKQLLPTFLVTLVLLLIEFFSLVDITNGIYQIFQLLSLLLLVFFAFFTTTTYLRCEKDEPKLIA